MAKSMSSSADLASPISLQSRAELGERLSATRRPRRGSRPWMTTRAPSVTQRRAIASPMPWVEPVMRMILDLRRMIGIQTDWVAWASTLARAGFEATRANEYVCPWHPDHEVSLSGRAGPTGALAGRDIVLSGSV